MKKVFLSIALFLIVTASFAQVTPQKRMFTYVATTMEYFKQAMIAGDVIFCDSNSTWYILKVPIWKYSDYNLHWVLASTARYKLPGIVSFSGTTITATGNATIGGTLGIVGATITAGLSPLTSNISSIGSASKLYKTAYIATLNSTYLKGTSSLTTSDSTTNLIALGTGAFGGAVTMSNTALVSGALTASVLPTFTIAAGTLHVLGTGEANDTIGVGVTGVTTSSIIIASYAPTTKALATLASDTAASAMCIHNGWVTVCGKVGRYVNYWIPKK